MSLVIAAFICRDRSACSEKGFAVEPCPVDWRVGGRDDSMTLSNVAARWPRTDLAIREWMGLIAYRATGKIDELLPGPAAK